MILSSRFRYILQFIGSHVKAFVIVPIAIGEI